MFTHPITGISKTSIYWLIFMWLIIYSSNAAPISQENADITKHFYILKSVYTVFTMCCLSTSVHQKVRRVILSKRHQMPLWTRVHPECSGLLAPPVSPWLRAAASRRWIRNPSFIHSTKHNSTLHIWIEIHRDIHAQRLPPLNGLFSRTISISWHQKD